MVENPRFVFKLLVTCPGASSKFFKGFHDEQVHWLPELDPEDDGELNYKVGAFQNRAGIKARTSQVGVKRSGSEWYENR